MGMRPGTCPQKVTLRVQWQTLNSSYVMKVLEISIGICRCEWIGIFGCALVGKSTCLERHIMVLVHICAYICTCTYQSILVSHAAQRTIYTFNIQHGAGARLEQAVRCLSTMGIDLAELIETKLFI
jgi:hypothetical protein